MSFCPSRHILAGLVLLSVITGASSLSAQTHVGGSISVDSTWTQNGSPYILDSSVIVENGATLTIEGGVHVQFTSSFDLSVTSGLIVTAGEDTFSSINPSNNEIRFVNGTSGTLNAVILDGVAVYCDGGSNPTITNNTITAVDWPITLEDGSSPLDISGNDLSGCIYEAIRIGGSLGRNWYLRDYSLPYILASSITMPFDNKQLTIESGVTVTMNPGAHIYVGWSSGTSNRLEATGVTFIGSGNVIEFDNYGRGTIDQCVLDQVRVFCDGGSNPTITNNTITAVDWPITLEDGSSPLDISGNDLSGCIYEAIRIGGSLGRNWYLRDYSLPYILASSITMPFDNKQLTIESGVTVTMNSSTNIFVGWNDGNNNTLTIEPGVAVIMHLGAEIHIGGVTGNNNKIDATGMTFRRSGPGGLPRIRFQNGNGTIDQCLLDGVGLLCEEGGNPNMSGCTIKNTSSAITVTNDGNPLISYNNIIDNAFGISNASANSTNAENNWWGDPRGPTHAENPEGQGDAVSSNVDYMPWLTAPVGAFNGRVEGIVFHDQDHDGVFTSPVDTTVSNALVVTQFGDSSWCNPLGRFSVTGLRAAGGYSITAVSAGFLPKTISGIRLFSDSLVLVDIGFDSLASDNVVLTEIVPDPNPLVSTIEQDGTAHRYYMATDSATGAPLPMVPVEVRREGSPFGTFLSDAEGILDIKIESSEIGTGNPGDAATFQIVSVGGKPIPPANQIDFTCEIRGREHTKFWEHDSFGRVGISYVQVEREGGTRTVLRETDENQSGPDRLLIGRQGRAGVGLEYKVQAPLQVDIGVTEVGAEAGVEGMMSVVTDDSYEFPHPIPDGETAQAEYILLASSKLSSLSNALIQLLTYLEDHFGGSLGDAYLTDGKGVDIRGSVSAEMNLGVGADRAVQLEANVEAGADAHQTFGCTWLDPENSLRYLCGSTVKLHVAASAGLRIFDDQARSAAGERLKDILGIEEAWTGSWGGGFAVVHEAVSGDIVAIEIRNIRNQYSESEGSEREVSLTVRGEDAIDSFRFLSHPGPAALLVGATAPVVLAAGPAMFGPLLLGSLNRLEELQDPSKSPMSVVNATQVSYEVLEGDVTAIDAFDVSLSLSLTGEQTISGSVGGRAGFREGYEAVTERGKWLRGRFYPEETYDQVPHDIASTYAELWEAIDQQIPLEIKILVFLINTWPLASPPAADWEGIAATDSFSVGDCGSYIIFPTGSVPDSVSEVSAYSWSWWGGSPCASSRSLSPAKLARHREIRREAEESFGMSYGIGGFYQFEPHGVPLQTPATFVMTYPDEDVVNIDEAELGMYREIMATHEFRFVGGVVGAGANTVTAQIDTLGLFTLAPRLPSGQIALSAFPPSLPANEVSTCAITSDTLLNNDGSLVDDGTMFTVSADAGFITSADVDTALDGTQVTSQGRTITYELRSGPIAFDANVTARSVYGSAEGMVVVAMTDSSAPDAPSGLEVQYHGPDHVLLTWTPSTDVDVAGYKVYFDDDSPDPPYTGQVSAEGVPSPVDVMADTSLIVVGLPPGYHYFAVTAYDVKGNESPYTTPKRYPTAIDEPVTERLRLALGHNYPNPFNPVTTIRYSLKEKAHVSLKIYNVSGRLVRTLLNREIAPSDVKPVIWDGLDNRGEPVASGVYFYRLATEDFSQTRKMVVLH